MKLFLQRQPFNLTMAKHNLDIHQLRIVSRIVNKLQPLMSKKIEHEEVPPDAWVSVNVAELIIGNNTKYLRDALDGLMKKIVRILHFLPEENTYLEIGLPMIQMYKYKHGTGLVKLKIGGPLLPQLLDLARGYTRYSLPVAFQTSSANVYKLYQYLSHYTDREIILCYLVTLREFLQIQGKYKLPSDIKRWILEPAMKELEAKADVWFSIVGTLKEGRRMLGWEFKIHMTKERRQEEERRKQKKEGLLSQFDEKWVSYLKRFGLGDKQIKKLLLNTSVLNTSEGEVQDFYKSHLYKSLREIELKHLDKKIQNLGGYTVAVLKKKFDIDL